MTRRNKTGRLSLIIVALLVIPFLIVETANAEEWGTLKGRFVYDGQAPAPKPIDTSKEPQCAAHHVVDESLIVGENGGLANAVVYLYTSRRQKPPAVHPDYEKTAKDKVELNNHGCRFEPHVLPLRTSQTLEIKNSDQFGHNTNYTGFGNPQFNTLIAAGTSAEKKLSNAQSAPGKVTCNIHPWMNGYVVVRDDPYIAVSAKDGTFEIKNLPVGEHEFQFWHEKSGNLKDVKIGDSTTSNRGRVKISIKSGDNDLGEIKLSPSMFK